MIYMTPNPSVEQDVFSLAKSIVILLSHLPHNKPPCPGLVSHVLQRRGFCLGVQPYTMASYSMMALWQTYFCPASPWPAQGPYL